MATINGSFTVIGGSGSYRVRVIDCVGITNTVAFTDITNAPTNGSVNFTVTTVSPINISYKIKVEDNVFGTLYAESACGDLVCECVPIQVGSITGTESGFINTAYTYTPSIDLGTNPIYHLWTITGDVTITVQTALEFTVIFNSTGIYTLTYSGTNNCGTDVITKTITIGSSCTDPTPAVVLTPDVTEICGSNSAVITATGCTGTVVWSNILGSPITNPNSNNNIFVVTSENKTLKAKCFNCQGSSDFSNIVSIVYLGSCANISNVTGNSIC